MRSLIAITLLFGLAATAGQGATPEAGWAWADADAARYAWASAPNCECNGTRPDCPCRPQAEAPACPCGTACDCDTCTCAQPGRPDTPEPPLTYSEAAARAVRDRARLVVFCGYYETRAIPGCVVVHSESERFPGLDLHGTSGAIVVGVPDGQPGLARCDLPITATDAQILAVAPPVIVQYRPPVYAPVFFGGGCASGRCGR